MMVALVIGVMLMLGVVQVFMASRTASRLAEGSARSQENGRFALEFLQRDIRMAGHFGCVNDQAHFVRGEGDPAIDTGVATGSGHPLDFSVSIQAYEAPSTAPGTSLTLGGTWAAPTGLPASISALKPRGGSDILVLRYLAAEGVPVLALAPSANSVVGFDTSAGTRLLEGGVAAPNLFGVADCSHANVFRGAYAAGKVTANGSLLDRYTVQPTGQTMIYRAESVVYFVGTSGTTGEPALMRARSDGGNGYSAAEELVEGIENMQLLFGLDATPAITTTTPPSGNITTVATASGVSTDATAAGAAQWRRVGQVQVGILARSPQSAQAESPADAINYPRALGVGFTPAAKSDGRSRMAYESTIALRNRLFGN